MYSHQILFLGLTIENIIRKKQQHAIIFLFYQNRILGPQLNVPVANSLWVGSHVGVGIYLYASKHLRNADVFDRLLYR